MKQAIGIPLKLSLTTALYRLGRNLAVAAGLGMVFPYPVHGQLVASPVSPPQSRSSDRAKKSFSQSATEAAKRLARFPGSLRRNQKKSPDAQSSEPSTSPAQFSENTPADPRKVALQAVVKAAIPADRHYRETLADAIATCYWRNKFKPLWRGKPLPDRIFRALSVQMARHAIPGTRILNPDSIQSALRDSPVDRKDLARTISIGDAGAQVRFGAVSSDQIWPDWDSGDTPGSDDRSAAGFALDLFRGSKSRPFSLVRVMDDLAPKSWIYRELQKGYEKSKASMLRYSGLPNIPDPASYGVARAGQSYPYAPALAAHLIDKGYLKLPAQQIAALSSLTPELTKALIAFQTDYGLEADGIMGSSSWRILNTNAVDLFRANTINLHRARLIPGNLGNRYVIINLPSAELFAFEKKDQLAFHMRVVHGKASDKDHRTPIFRDVMQEIVFGPYWNVPKSIAMKEIIPKVLEEPDYLSRNNYEIVDSFSSSGAKVFDQSPETLNQVAEGTLFLRQTPGSDNALGHVKFLLPNQFNVYLHDTPSKRYFVRSQRDQSHGCIRLAEPKKMALWTLGSQGWDQAKITQAMEAKKRTGHRVENGLNVYITYFTLFPRPQGNGLYVLAPARDVYGLDPVDTRTLAAVIPWEESGGQ